MAKIIAPNFNAIPEFLRNHPYWSVWPAIPRENGKIGKPPLGINGKFNKANNPVGWCNFATIQTFYETNQGKEFSYTDKGINHKGPISGVGILLDHSSSFVGIDFDAILEADGTIAQWAYPLIQELRSITYCEISPSGTGIRAFIQGKKPSGRCRRGDLEIYDNTRFLTVTGHKLEGCPNEAGSGPKAQAIIDKLVAYITQTNNPISTRGEAQPSEAAREQRQQEPLTDSELLDKIRQSKQGKKFSTLYDAGNISFYGDDQSAADQALCNILASWTAKDAGRMDRLMRQSAFLTDSERLAKWDKVHSQGATYGEMTIAKAIQDCKWCYEPKEVASTSAKREKREKHTANTGANNSKNEYTYTEDALALIFESKYRDTLRYDHTRKTWYGWNGKYWQVDDKGRAFDRIREICRNAAKEVSKQEAFYLKKASTTSAVNKFAQCAEHLAVTHEIWDSNDFLLGTPGGIVDLKTGQLMPGKRELYISRITAIAPADKADALLWLKFLSEATNGDPDLQRYLQQISGMCLTGCTREHALFFVYGDGGNGKSVFLNTLRAIIGQYATAAQMETFTASKNDRHPAELAALNGARLVTVSETEEGRAWAEVKVKQFTGGDPMTARYMRGNPFEFKPKAKLIIIGNHKPALRNVDDAMRRRLNIIPFIHKPKKVDEKLPEKLEAEYPAILRWAIDGCLDWQKNGLQRPTCVTEATQEYFEDQDAFGQWLEECCVKYDGFTAKGNTLFASWKEYAEKCGIYPGNAKSFAGEMQKRGFERDRDSTGARGFKGITLKSEEN